MQSMAIKSETPVRNVFITGGTGSVGQALVEAFATVGHRVTFQFRQNESIAKRLGEVFGARPMRLDFASDFELSNVDFDVVINNAGINISDTRVHEVTVHDWDLTLRVNLTAPFFVARQCLPWMIDRRWGRIINISSIYGLRAVEGNFPYTVSKHGLSGLTRTIAKEYAAFGITSNEICPGPIESDMMRDIASKSVAGTGRSLDAYFAEVCDEVPAKRMAIPEEVAALAVFLASPQAGYINGASLPIDGAMIA